jgi:hypothetical protein
MSETNPATPEADKLAPPVHEFPKVEAASLVAAPVTPVQVSEVPRVFVALCTRDWQSEVHNSESVRAIGRACRAQLDVRYQMNDGVARARNNLAASFLEGGCDVLFFLDNDIIIEPGQFDSLLAGFSKPERHVVCGLYPKKQPTLEWVCNALEGEKPDPDGFQKMKHAGNCCMMITRDALLSYIKAHPEIEYKGDPSPDAVRWDLFPMHSTGPDSPGPQIDRIRAILGDGGCLDPIAAIKSALERKNEAGRYDSEDWAFCNRMRAAGFDIYMDIKVQLRHVGKCVYPLQLSLSDDEIVDVVARRYDIEPDLVRTFIATGSAPPGFPGGHRRSSVRLWPREYPVGDLHQSDVMAGCYDVPYDAEGTEGIGVIDIGADVGAFARFAAKRWRGCQLHCYESRANVLPLLQQTADNIAANYKKAKPIVYVGEVRPMDVAALPLAAVIKIDARGTEREIVEALAACGRIADFDAIMIRYYDELTALFIRKLCFATHVTHCQQRFTEDMGILKFLRRTEVVAP